jgi:hypothetical protein
VKINRLSIIFWCWLWYALGQCADMLTSLSIWGGEELNPYFRDANHQFMAGHAVFGKLSLTFIMGALSCLLYRLAKPLDERLANILACIGPLYFGWMLWQVANNNFFMIMRWVNP